MAQHTPPQGSVAPDQTNVPGVVIYPAPPAGFDALTASDADLAQYGFPPRPDAQSAPEAYAHWQKMVASPQKRITPKLQQTTIYNGPAQDVSVGETLDNGAVASTSTNWSGYVVTGPKGMLKVNNSYVYAEWVVPIAQQAYKVCNGGWDYSSQWVGIDGSGSSDVLQAGTEADAYCSGGTTGTFYSPWFEWFPNSEVRITNLPANPGDLIIVEVWYTTAAPLGHAYIVNYGTNPAESVNIGFNPPKGTTLNGNSVEWIVERPGISGGLATLTNYSAVPFNLAHARKGTTSNFYYPGSSPAGTTIYDSTMVCPPWTPSSSCTSPTAISYVDLYGAESLWFYPEGPAY
ncbi:MAG: G1 family glutamic endopeptidase [Candidatus Binataceae bacterium]